MTKYSKRGLGQGQVTHS